jgi:uncharacterized zinc-type alcohol dehydrogenase-like protein
MIDDDWKMSEYPLIAGHEIVGLVEKAGDNVKDVFKGDRVGVGWQCGSCLKCGMCKSGYEQLCVRMNETCVGRNGGFASHIKIDSRFVYKIPKSLSSDGAAPLFCAGITVYQPMKYAGVKKGVRVGVIGLGGLGHMAVKFASSWGCEVVVFSTSKDKEKVAKAMGAKFVSDLSDNKLDRSVDFLIDTSSVQIDWDRYMQILSPLGTLCVVGVPGGKVKVLPISLIAGQKSIMGGSIGGRGSMKEMLLYCAKKGIEADVEVYKTEEINKAVEKLKTEKPSKRLVIKF